MNYQKFRKTKEFFILIGCIVCSNCFCQPVNFEHYQRIISDTMITDSDIGLKEIFYSSERKLKRKSGKVLSLKYYSNKKIVYKKNISGKISEECFYIYDNSGRLVSEYRYDFKKLLKSFTLFFYDDIGRLSYSLNTTDNKKYKVLFRYLNTGEVGEANLVVNDKYNYVKRVYLYSKVENIVKKIVLVTDTSSNFKIFDTLGTEWTDTQQRVTTCIFKSKNLIDFKYKFFGLNGLLLNKSSQIIDEDGTFFSEYTEYDYLNNNEVFVIERTQRCTKEKSYTYSYKTKFEQQIQPAFKFN